MNLKKIFFSLILFALASNSIRAQAWIWQSPCPVNTRFGSLKISNLTDSSVTISGALNLKKALSDINSFAPPTCLGNKIKLVIGIWASTNASTPAPGLLEPTLFQGDTLYIKNPGTLSKDSVYYSVNISGLQANNPFTVYPQGQIFLSSGCNFTPGNSYLYNPSSLTAYQLANDPDPNQVNTSQIYFQNKSTSPYSPPAPLSAPAYGLFFSTLPNSRPPVILPNPIAPTQGIFQTDQIVIDNISKITDTSATVNGHFNFYQATIDSNFNLAGGKRFKLIPITSYGFGSDGAVLGDTIIITNSNFNTVGMSVPFSVRLHKLQPGTYYRVHQLIRVIALDGVFGQKNLDLPRNTCQFMEARDDSKYPYNSFNAGYPSFRTSSGKIAGNILGPDMAICSQGTEGSYITPQIQAGTPAGGFNNYSYQWQKISESTGQWENCASASSGNPTYAPAIITNPKQPFMRTAYRRIVYSGANYADTSNTIAITYLPIGYSPLIHIQPVAAPNKDISLQIISERVGSLSSIVWTDSIDGQNSFIQRTLISSRVDLKYDLGDTDHVYRAIITYNGTCPSYSSKCIYISKPDGDGNMYPAVKISNQTWMVNNLRTTKFNDGTRIKSVTNEKTNSTATYSWYNKDSVLNSFKFGALYNVTVINNGNFKNACPSGWKAADVMDWEILFENIGGAHQAGNLLKSLNGWSATNNISNVYNFNAAPAGEYVKDYDGDWNYYGKNELATWWGVIPDTRWDKPKYSGDYYMMTDADGKVYFQSPVNSKVDDTRRSIRCVQYK